MLGSRLRRKREDKNVNNRQSMLSQMRHGPITTHRSKNGCVRVSAESITAGAGSGGATGRPVRRRPPYI